MSEIEKIYSVREVMQILGRSNATVRAYISAGLLKARKLKPDAKNSKYIITESDLKAFIDGGEVPRGYYQELYPRPHKRDQAAQNK